jgi:hypothetical protein
VKHGRIWDPANIQFMTATKIFSKHFVILHTPTYEIQDYDVEDFDNSNIMRALQKRVPKVLMSEPKE